MARHRPDPVPRLAFQRGLRPRLARLRQRRSTCRPTAPSSGGGAAPSVARSRAGPGPRCTSARSAAVDLTGAGAGLVGVAPARRSRDRQSRRVPEVDRGSCSARGRSRGLARHTAGTDRPRACARVLKLLRNGLLVSAVAQGTSSAVPPCAFIHLEQMHGGYSLLGS